MQTNIKMPPNLKGTKTEQCLRDAFSGESQARNKYNIYQVIARQEGLEQIAAYFGLTADNEHEHAVMIAKFLGLPGTTAQNLLSSVQGEHYEHSTMYKAFEQTARDEGFIDIATYFREVAEVEEEHEKRFAKLLLNLENNHVFQRPESEKWLCRNCGYVHEGKEAPGVCPSCRHPQSYFELYCENY